MKKDFRDWLFDGLEYMSISNKYYKFYTRHNKDFSKVLLRISETSLIPTQYGYAMVLDYEHILFLKFWQVGNNYYGTFVILEEKYFKPKKWGTHIDWWDEPKCLEWAYWANAAKLQQNGPMPEALWRK